MGMDTTGGVAGGATDPAGATSGTLGTGASGAMQESAGAPVVGNLATNANSPLATGAAAARMHSVHASFDEPQVQSSGDLLDSMWSSLRDEVMPPSQTGDLGLGMWTAGRGMVAAGATAEWMTDVQHGTFAPRDAAGRYISTQAPWHQNAMRAMQSRNWQALPYQSATRARWATVGTVTGRAGGALSIGTSALDQWTRDSGRTDLSDAERVGRTAYRAGVAGGLGGIGGGWAGAQVGAGIGFAVGGPVGAAVGGVVGGIAGGVAGTGVGNWVADRTVDLAGDATQWTVDAVGDAADAVGEAFEDATGAVTDFVGSVGDELAFW